MGEIRKRGRVYWIRYYRDGLRHEESAETHKKKVAIDLLRVREGDGAKGIPVSARLSRFRFDEAATDLITEYRVNNRQSLAALDRRITKHLTPFFTGRRMSTISAIDVREYIAHRQTIGILATRGRRQGERIADVSNGEINRELTALKRMFSLAIEAEKLFRKPHIALLEERNTRTGFFEREMLDSVLTHLPAALRPVMQFAYITGWRIPSEVLPLEWRQIDFPAGDIRLDPETTKNRDARVFPMTDDLRALLVAQDVERQRLAQLGQIVPWVFFRLVAKGRGGKKSPKPITRFNKAWKTATRAAGCPGRIPHDFRRTAIRNMIRRGVPERVAMQLAGHKTRSVFDRYNIVSAGDLRTAAEQLSGLTGTKQGQSAPATAAGPAKRSQSFRKSGGAARI